jgi:hypothetical protein
MKTSEKLGRAPNRHHRGRRSSVAPLICCLAIGLLLTTLVASGAPMWLRSGLGLAGLALLGGSGGLLVAHYLLDERRLSGSQQRGPAARG